MSPVPLSRQTVKAVVKYGANPALDRLAEQRYHVTGEQLLARLVAGESADNPDAVSSAGARGRTQFMPATRAVVMQRYGIDPWKNADQAVHATVLHLLGKLGNAKGLEGYNPGSASYPSYILSRRTNLGAAKRQLGLTGGAPAAGGGTRAASAGAATSVGSLAGLLGLPTGAIDTSGLVTQRTQAPTSGPASPTVDARASLPLPRLPGGQATIPDSSAPPLPPTSVADLLSKAGGATTAPTLTGVTVPGSAGTGGGAQGAPSTSAEVHIENAVDKAKSFLGVSEIGASNRGKQVDRFERRFGAQGQAWCGFFVGTVLQKTGVKGIDSRIGSVAAIEQMAKAGTGGMKRWLSTSAARPGDLLITSKGQHVALVTKVVGDRIWTIAGNSGNKVQRVEYTKGSTYGIARPKYG